MIRKWFKNAVKNQKTAPGADCDSDHVPVVCQIKVNLKNITKKRKNPKLDIYLLRTDPNIKNRYDIAVKNIFEALQMCDNVDSIWQHLKNSIIKAANELIPPKQMEGKKKWMTQEILDLMETRRKSKHKDIKYSWLNKKIKKKCNKAKNHPLIISARKLKANGTRTQNLCTRRSKKRQANHFVPGVGASRTKKAQ